MRGFLRSCSTLVCASALAFGCGDDSGDDGGAAGEAGEPNTPYTCTESGVCTLQGELTEDLTLTADKQWLLRGGVFVGNDVDQTVLTIEPGTTLFGEASSTSFLAVRRGSKIMAEGTREAPIVFTSAKEPGTRARGDWGGIIINGRARINACADGGDTCEAEGEGGTGFYGGDDNTDNSGVLRYVRVEFGGKQLSPDNELNGIAFQAVGSGTTVEYVQVHMSKDDGVEFFGGACNFRYVVTTGIGDDNLDWTEGWVGKGQFFIAQQYADDGDNGIEADNNGKDNGAEPRSNPTLSNLTLIGVQGGENSDIGMLLREGTAGRIYKTIIMGWGEAAVDIDNEATFAVASADGASATGDLVVENSIAVGDTLYGADEEGTDPWAVETWFKDWMTNNTFSNPMLAAPYAQVDRDFAPMDGSPALGAGEAMPSDPFFTATDYIGAIGDDDWTEGWTTDVQN